MLTSSSTTIATTTRTTRGGSISLYRSSSVTAFSLRRRRHGGRIGFPIQQHLDSHIVAASVTTMRNKLHRIGHCCCGFHSGGMIGGSYPLIHNHDHIAVVVSPMRQMMTTKLTAAATTKLAFSSSSSSGVDPSETPNKTNKTYQQQYIPTNHNQKTYMSTRKMTQTNAATELSSVKSATARRIQGYLRKSKLRYEHGIAVVEGPRIIFDLLRNPQTRPLVQEVLVDVEQQQQQCNERKDNGDDDKPDNPHHQHMHKDYFQKVLQQLQRQPPHNDNNNDDNNDDDDGNKSPRLFWATPQVVQSCCDTVTPQGMIATVKIPHCHDSKNQDDESEDQSISLLTTLLLQQQHQFQHQQHTQQEQQQGVTRSKSTRNVNNSKNHSKLVLILDGVSDPGNLGTLLRTSVAVGVYAVLLLPNCCDPYSPKAIRSAMGATFVLPVLLSVNSWQTCFQQLQHAAAAMQQQQQQQQQQHPSQRQDSEVDNVSEAKATQAAAAIDHRHLKIWAATMVDDCPALETKHDDARASSSSSLSSLQSIQAIQPSLPYYQVDWTQSYSASSSTTKTATFIHALVIGGEGNGLSSPVRQALSDGNIRAVHVPMQTGIESLNAAICGSVILFEAHRQRSQQQ